MFCPHLVCFAGPFIIMMYILLVIMWRCKINVNNWPANKFTVYGSVVNVKLYICEENAALHNCTNFFLCCSKVLCMPRPSLHHYASFCYFIWFSLTRIVSTIHLKAMCPTILEKLSVYLVFRFDKESLIWILSLTPQATSNARSNPSHVGCTAHRWGAWQREGPAAGGCQAAVHPGVASPARLWHRTLPRQAHGTQGSHAHLTQLLKLVTFLGYLFSVFTSFVYYILSVSLFQYATYVVILVIYRSCCSSVKLLHGLLKERANIYN